jgi:hypothetical protein
MTDEESQPRKVRTTFPSDYATNKKTERERSED